jgi:hypothetical protein
MQIEVRKRQTEYNMKRRQAGPGNRRANYSKITAVVNSGRRSPSSPGTPARTNNVRKVARDRRLFETINMLRRNGVSQKNALVNAVGMDIKAHGMPAPSNRLFGLYVRVIPLLEKKSRGILR